MSKKRKYLIRKAANHVRWKLKRRDRIIDLRNRRLSKIEPRGIARAKGFLVNLRVYGKTIIVKPADIASWIREPVGVIEVVKQLARRGRLIRGCDGKLTRQVQIAGRRQRYFCFPMGNKVRAADYPVKRQKASKQSRSLFGRVNRDHKLPMSATDDIEDAELMRPIRPNDSDDDLSDWDNDKPDRRGIGVVLSPGWALRSVEDFRRPKKPTE